MHGKLWQVAHRDILSMPIFHNYIERKTEAEPTHSLIFILIICFRHSKNESKQMQYNNFCIDFYWVTFTIFKPLKKQKDDGKQQNK